MVIVKKSVVEVEVASGEAIPGTLCSKRRLAVLFFQTNCELSAFHWTSCATINSFPNLSDAVLEVSFSLPFIGFSYSSIV
jgi:hypothetical protein